MINLHYWPTPNGKKVTILLEELGVPYTIVPVNIGRGDQFKDDYLKINPNTRMPALVDTEPADGGGPLSVFESGAIMMYLGEKFGKFYPQELRQRYPSFRFVGVDCAALSPADGQVDPYAALMGFRKAAEGLGISYLKDRLVGLELSDGLVREARLL